MHEKSLMNIWWYL